jgi:hypothetical protein
MDFVYVSKQGDNEELRYSIRSVRKNFLESNVWLVGGKPDWYNGNFIPVENISSKFNNIRNCIKQAALSKEISDDFILMNDDFFIIKEIDSMPVLHGGLLQDRISRYVEATGGNRYATLLSLTNLNLKRQGIKHALDYDIHVPIQLNKSKVLEVVDQKLSFRSVYGNKFNIGGTQTKDVKVYGSKLLKDMSYSFLSEDPTFISTEDLSFDYVYNEILKDMFYEPSEYESK